MPRIFSAPLGTIALLASVASSCGPPMSPGISPSLTPASEMLGVRTTMVPVTTLPVRLDSSSSPKTVFRWRHSYAGATTPLPPMLMLMDGVALGVRPDGTVDHATAKLLLQRVYCREVVSIQVLKSEPAMRRFGPAGKDGAILIVTNSHRWRAEAGNP